MDDPAYLAMRAGDEDPGDLDLDPENAPPEVDEGELTAEAAEMAVTFPERSGHNVCHKGETQPAGR
jgi:hypothetical protein